MSAQALLSLVALLLLLVSTESAQATLKLQVDRTTINAGDSLTLNLDYDGSAAAPDLSALQQDFQVMASQQTSQVQINNGRISRRRTVQLRLLPKRTGQLTIPALRWGTDSTTTVSITVGDAQTGNTQPGSARPDDPASASARADTGKAARFESHTTPATAYVQGQLTYTRRLLYNGDAQVYGELPELPDIPGAIVQPLTAPAPDSTEIEGVTYGVYEQRFAIFPQESGELVIPAVGVDASISQPDGGRRHARISSQPIRVHILPKPADFPSSAAWLPAQHVQLDERWTLPQHLEVGQPIMRTVRISSEGLSNSVLPPMPWKAIAGTRFYSEPATEQESTDGVFITGTRTQQFTWIPTHPGRITLPGVQLLWWDVNAGSIRRATLPQRTLVITGSAAPPDPRSVLPRTARDAPAQHAAAGRAWLDAFRAPPLSGIVVAVLVIAISWLVWLAGRATVRVLGARRRTHIAMRHSPTRLAAVQWSRLSDACRTNDARAAHRAFTEWVALQANAPTWRQAGVAQRLRAASYPLADASAAAGNAPHIAPDWNGAEFWQWLLAQRAAASALAASGARPWQRLRKWLGASVAATLPPLYQEPTQAASASDFVTTSKTSVDNAGS